MEIKEPKTFTSETNEKEAMISTLQGEVKEHKTLGLEKDPQNPALKAKGKDLATARQESSDTTGITKLSEIEEPSFIESKEKCSKNEEVLKAIETANLKKSGSEGLSQTQQKI